ncbi:beta-ketoacyl synthase N-terminal-like domain-containing protein, partial [Nocardia sp. NPDC050697]|uniref:beta-ketoacyl synthase N-terminal-like domain-containing protein n=1 Tax=Nocardia sp. NPDC050697 TaxID=3155158 RepID=UPI0033C2FA3A
MHIYDIQDSSADLASADNVDDLVAIVGISCRFPGAANLAEFWDILREAKNVVAKISEARIRLTDLGRLDVGGEALCGGFIAGVDLFDSEFFGISSLEAASLDPQQRLVLEMAWEALEDAQVVPSPASSKNVGVFLGAMSEDYAKLTHDLGEESISSYSFAGLQRSMIANRVSSHLGLTGPSLIVDSGQSSSLVAVHLACKSITSGESDVALAGAVNLLLSAESWLTLRRLGVLSTGGKSYPFDSRANGYVRGEGGGIVVLKKYSSALADGDKIYCVIRGSAINNDGGSSSFLAPSKVSQEELLTRVYRDSGADPDLLAYIECHGTGTKIGDPIEAGAIGAVFSSIRSRRSSIAIGSVKTNIGHLEGASGIAGLIKAALILDKGAIPPSLNYEVPNGQINFSELGIHVNTGLKSLSSSVSGPPIVGVSSFGLGGTNAHVILEQAPDSVAVEAAGNEDVAEPSDAGVVGGQRDVLPVAGWVLSGRSEAALRGQAARLR